MSGNTNRRGTRGHLPRNPAGENARLQGKIARQRAGEETSRRAEAKVEDAVLHPLTRGRAARLARLNVAAQRGADVRQSMGRFMATALSDEVYGALLEQVKSLDPADAKPVLGELGYMQSSGEQQNRAIAGQHADGYMAGAYPKLQNLLLAYGLRCGVVPRDSEVTAWIDNPRHLWIGDRYERTFGEEVRRFDERCCAVAANLRAIAAGSSDLWTTSRRIVTCASDVRAFVDGHLSLVPTAAADAVFVPFLRPVIVGAERFAGPDPLSVPGWQAVVSAVRGAQGLGQDRGGGLIAMVHELLGDGLIGGGRARLRRRRERAERRERVELAASIGDLIQTMFVLQVRMLPAHLIATGGAGGAYDAPRELAAICEWLERILEGLK